jgi:hypothetical protein
MIIAKFSICCNVIVGPKGYGFFSLLAAFQNNLNNLGAVTEMFLLM